MINGQNLINDGLDANCKNNGLPTWSVNQGVILGALVELSKGSLSGVGVLDSAKTLAKAAIQALSNQDGILVEANKCEMQPSACGADAKQFKGVFIRNLGYLNEVIGDGDIRAFILNNADSVWGKDRQHQQNGSCLDRSCHRCQWCISRKCSGCPGGGCSRCLNIHVL